MFYSDEFKLPFDFSQVKDTKFRCQEKCGLCCYNQFSIVTLKEINGIINYLRSLNEARFEGFISNIYSFLEMEDESPEDSVRNYRESMFSFWMPINHMEAEEGIVVRNYAVLSMPSSGRCIFLDPIERTCFVYPVRPYVCKLYPLTIEFHKQGLRRVTVGMKECPGIGDGERLDFNGIKRNDHEFLNLLFEDMERYESFVREKGLTPIQAPKRAARKKDGGVSEHCEEPWLWRYFFKMSGNSLPNKKVIEPFVEEGLMPEHPLIKAWNEKIDHRC